MSTKLSLEAYHTVTSNAHDLVPAISSTVLLISLTCSSLVLTPVANLHRYHSYELSPPGFISGGTVMCFLSFCSSFVIA